MAVFLTGGNGFLGSYVVNDLLTSHREKLYRCSGRREEAAREKLWKGMQLHMTPERFWRLLGRIEFIYGDLHAPKLGIDPKVYRKLTRRVDSVLHIAASLNRKSSKACLNTNLRGTLSVIQLARDIQDTSGLKRYSHVSTVAVAGKRDSEVVLEDGAIEWERSDYDPYGRTKKFCEHMARELLPDVEKVFFRPSIVMGDSRFRETSQFDMVRAFCLLAQLPVIPLDPSGRLDIVNADWVSNAISTLHTAKTRYATSITFRDGPKTIGDVAVRSRRDWQKPFSSRLETPRYLTNAVASLRPVHGDLRRVALKVFLPYVTYDTVFDNQRAVDEVGRPHPSRITVLTLSPPTNNHSYPYRALPKRLRQRRAA